MGHGMTQSAIAGTNADIAIYMDPKNWDRPTEQRSSIVDLWLKIIYFLSDHDVGNCAVVSRSFRRFIYLESATHIFWQERLAKILTHSTLHFESPIYGNYAIQYRSQRRFLNSLCKPPNVSHQKLPFSVDNPKLVKVHGSKVFSYKNDFAIHTYDFASNKCTNYFLCPTVETSYVKALPVVRMHVDEAKIYLAHDNGSISEWDKNSGELKAIMNHPQKTITCMLTFNEWLVLGTRSDQLLNLHDKSPLLSTLYIWNIQARTGIAAQFCYDVATLFTSSDGIFCSSNNAVYSFNIQTGKCIASFNPSYDRITCVKWAAGWLILGFETGNVSVWKKPYDLNSLTKIENFREPINDLDIYGQYLFSFTQNNFSVWSIASFTTLWVIKGNVFCLQRKGNQLLAIVNKCWLSTWFFDNSFTENTQNKTLINNSNFKPLN